MMERRAISLVGVFAAGLLAVVCAAPPGAAYPAARGPLTWTIDDPDRDGGHRTVEVEKASLHARAPGRIGLRIHGREFVEDRTDYLRLWFDARQRNTGPEYRFTWYLGRNPSDQPKGAMGLTRIDTWGGAGRLISCPGIRRNVDYRLDRLWVSIPRRCLGYPRAVRWSGMVGLITSVKNGYLYGRWDWFPGKHRFERRWVGQRN